MDPAEGPGIKGMASAEDLAKPSGSSLPPMAMVTVLKTCVTHPPWMLPLPAAKPCLVPGWPGQMRLVAAEKSTDLGLAKWRTKETQMF